MMKQDLYLVCYENHHDMENCLVLKRDHDGVLDDMNPFERAQIIRDKCEEVKDMIPKIYKDAKIILSVTPVNKTLKEIYNEKVNDEIINMYRRASKTILEFDTNKLRWVAKYNQPEFKVYRRVGKCQIFFMNKGEEKIEVLNKIKNYIHDENTYDEIATSYLPIASVQESIDYICDLLIENKDTTDYWIIGDDETKVATIISILDTVVSKGGTMNVPWFHLLVKFLDTYDTFLEYSYVAAGTYEASIIEV